MCVSTGIIIELLAYGEDDYDYDKYLGTTRGSPSLTSRAFGSV